MFQSYGNNGNRWGGGSPGNSAWGQSRGGGMSRMGGYRPAPMPNPITGGSGMGTTNLTRGTSPYPGMGNVPFRGGITGAGSQQSMGGSSPGYSNGPSGYSGGAYGGGNPYDGDPNGYGGPPAGYGNAQPVPMPNPIVGGGYQPAPMPNPIIGGGGYQPAPMPNPIVGGGYQPMPMPNPVTGGPGPVFNGLLGGYQPIPMPNQIVRY